MKTRLLKTGLEVIATVMQSAAILAVFLMVLWLLNRIIA